MKLDGCVYIVTGGASGLGEAVVRMAVANGGKVSIFDMNMKKGEALVDELGKDNAMMSKVNVTNEENVVQAVQATVEKFGKIDVVVNSAGVAGAALTVNRKGEPHGLNAFRRILDINVVGTFLVSSKCAAQMHKQELNSEGGRGLIVNISSAAALDGQNGQVAYAASKGAVLSMALPMARDLSKIGIRVNTICPGIFDTPMGGSKKPVDHRDVTKLNKVQQSLLNGQLFPNSRFGNPSELATLVKAMVEVPMLNAEYIRLDAGIRMPKL
ncbi:3-hydroxyacyl-CoA dehydrogenase type-2 [Diplonema papillatum]|nr:3-hydroxyacyl-CoA dehydrogenase type-2 [Diplonema papillatum]